MTYELDPKNTALIVVDMQNDFVHPDGELYSEASGDAVEPVKEMVERADEAGAEVVFTRDTHTEEQFDGANYYDEYERWGKHVEEGSWGSEILEDLQPELHADHVVKKYTYDAFYHTKLHEWLVSQGIGDLLIVGTLANVCVLHTAGSAGLRDFRPIIVEDALGYIQESHKEYAVNHADWLFGESAKMDQVRFDSEN